MTFRRDIQPDMTSDTSEPVYFDPHARSMVFENRRDFPAADLPHVFSADISDSGEF